MFDDPLFVICALVFTLCAYAVIKDKLAMRRLDRAIRGRKLQAVIFGSGRVERF